MAGKEQTEIFSVRLAVRLYSRNTDGCFLLAGRSHDKSFVLFHIGEAASDGLKLFCETGQTDDLEAQSQGEGGVFDEFSAPAIPSGVGSSRTEFFVDGNHTKVGAPVVAVRFCFPFRGSCDEYLCSVLVQFVDCLVSSTGGRARKCFREEVIDIALII